MNHTVRIACPRLLAPDEPCEADLIVTIGGKCIEDSFIDEIEAECGHVHTDEEQEKILELGNEELADRERDRLEYSADDFYGRT